MEENKYLYYRGNYDNLRLKSLSLEKDYRLEVWSPKIFRITPKDLFLKSFVAWRAFHCFGFFKNREYKVFIVYFKGKEAAHYSAVLPKHFRMPFMKDNDLQIGPVDTVEKHRKKGLASFAFAKILDFYKDKKMDFWYIVREENEVSRRFIEKAGFLKYGRGIKIKKPGFGLFDKFVIEKKY